MDIDEANLLAALGSSVRDTTDYERDVLRTAEWDDVPQLSGIGFPAAMSATLDTSRVAEMRAVLARVRDQLQGGGATNGATTQQQRLHLFLKQQVLIRCLQLATSSNGSTGTTSNEESFVRPQEEARQEQERRKRFRSSQQSTANKKRKVAPLDPFHQPIRSALNKRKKLTVAKTTEQISDQEEDIDESTEAATRLEQIKKGKSVSFSVAIASSSTSKKRTRIGMQKRRKSDGTNKKTVKKKHPSKDEEEDDAEFKKRKAHLKAMRQQKEAKRKHRRKTWDRGVASMPSTREEELTDEGEAEFDDPTPAPPTPEESKRAAAPTAPRTMVAVQQEEDHAGILPEQKKAVARAEVAVKQEENHDNVPPPAESKKAASSTSKTALVVKQEEEYTDVQPKQEEVNSDDTPPSEESNKTAGSTTTGVAKKGEGTAKQEEEDQTAIPQRRKTTSSTTRTAMAKKEEDTVKQEENHATISQRQKSRRAPASTASAVAKKEEDVVKQEEDHVAIHRRRTSKKAPVSTTSTAMVVKKEEIVKQEEDHIASAPVTRTVGAVKQEADQPDIPQYTPPHHYQNAATSTTTVAEKQEEDRVDATMKQEDPRCSSPVTTVCPLCQETIVAARQEVLDEILSQHMEGCQSTRTRRQRRRATAQAKNYREEEDFDMDDNLSAVSHTMVQDDGDDDDDDLEGDPDVGVVDSEDDEELDADDNGSLSSSCTNTKQKQRQRRLVHPEPYPVVDPIEDQPLDDWDEDAYEDRVYDWIEEGIQRMRVMKERDTEEIPPGEMTLDGGLFVPAWVNDRLFSYQRTGLQWMWELHRQQAGGVIGDEMGLGKTVQVCSFLGCMAASRKLKSVLVIAPATMLQHWLKEFAIWAPGLRRFLIHQSAGEVGTNGKRVVSSAFLRYCDKWLKTCRRQRLYEVIDEEDLETREQSSFCGTGYVVVTTYENIRRFPEIWTNHCWSYVTMDEAQKIRNPNADVTLACKRIRTPHRLALSGTPIQNDLRELWSLFDWVFPGRLGTLPAFETEFADPIKRGGYTNASPMQVQLAFRCALVLKDLIHPYLLRRLKREIKEIQRMPGKKEQVLFCRLSDQQRNMYESFINSDKVKGVMRGSTQLLSAVTALRKICNHPLLMNEEASLESFLAQGDVDEDDTVIDDDAPLYTHETAIERSGKLEVLAKILPLWKTQGHRVIIFCQWKKMLDIIQRFTEHEGWKFGRLDGNTNVASRQRLVDKFNSDKSYFGMLCTTRTGGVGLNLTGADRIILYDPDWNPMTDAQARERAWRFGQEREVTIYRLIVAGTVEEKIYQRQIFKTALSNRVLENARQKRIFSQRDLKDLFSLKADTGSVAAGGDGVVETSQLANGDGYIDPDAAPISESSNDDGGDGETLQNVLQSKGLAGVFDHNTTENQSFGNQNSVREMEAKAKTIAKEAVKSLRASVSNQEMFSPTFTGSEGIAAGRFGHYLPPSTSVGDKVKGTGSAVNGSAATSSATLLTNIRSRNDEVNNAEGDGKGPKAIQEYSKLLQKIKIFVSRAKPTTDELLDEFSTVKSYDAAVFRRLLKSVAIVVKGRWRLR